MKESILGNIPAVSGELRANYKQYLETDFDGPDYNFSITKKSMFGNTEEVIDPIGLYICASRNRMLAGVYKFTNLTEGRKPETRAIKLSEDGLKTFESSADLLEGVMFAYCKERYWPKGSQNYISLHLDLQRLIMTNDVSLGSKDALLNVITFVNNKFGKNVNASYTYAELEEEFRFYLLVGANTIEKSLVKNELDFRYMAGKKPYLGERVDWNLVGNDEKVWKYLKDQITPETPLIGALFKYLVGGPSGPIIEIDESVAKERENALGRMLHLAIIKDSIELGIPHNKVDFNTVTERSLEDLLARDLHFNQYLEGRGCIAVRAPAPGKKNPVIELF